MKGILAKALTVLIAAAILMSAILPGAVLAEENVLTMNNLEATAIPRNEPRDPDDPRNQSLSKKIGDAIIDIGKNFIPFGDTIVNVIKRHSSNGEDSSVVSDIVDLTADTVSTVLPLAEPIVTVAKDLAHKIIDFFN